MNHVAKALTAITLLILNLGPGLAKADDDLQPTPNQRAESEYLLDTWLQSVIDYDRLPGVSLVIVDDQEIVYSKGFGYADMDSKTAATGRTVYSICSITKLFTATAIMQLQEAGKLSLDDPLSKYLDWFQPELVTAGSRQPTIGDVLNHTGGMPCAPDKDFWPITDSLFPASDALRDRISNLEMSYGVGEVFNYSNLGYALLGQVISEITGIEYSQYIKTLILDPLGMQSTTLVTSDFGEAENDAKGYGNKTRGGPRAEVQPDDFRAMSPAEGYVSSAEDLAKFAMWQFRVIDGEKNEILSAETLREMYAAKWTSPQWGLGYGIWNMGEKTLVGHWGGCWGYISQFLLCPEDKIAVIVTTNATDAPQFSMAFSAYAIMAPYLRNAESRVEEKDVWTDYVGFYDTDKTWSAAEVVEWHDSLAVMWVPAFDPLRSLTMLAPVEGDIFRQVNSDGSLGKHFIFEKDSDGNVVGFKFNSNQLRKTARK